MDEFRHLPVPDIRDDVLLQHSYKRPHRRDDSSRLRPPKLRTRFDSSFSRCHSYTALVSSAHIISFREENESSEMEELPMSSSYNLNRDGTYFEQCFECLSKIGEGSFGEVFKVRSKEDGLLYAVKKSKQLFRGEHYRQWRLEEVRRYEQFSYNDNCVRFYRAWEQDDCLYMQMELCRENLEHYLEERKQLPEEEIWSILSDLLLALKGLHDRNLIHLDIKLDNVLIADNNSCKLADFGLVVDINKVNKHNTTEGDSRYIAPEIMQGNFSKAADIFSLGIAMLELSCSLELPSYGPLWQQLRSGILPADFIKKISLELQTIIKHMMSPEPKARPTVDQLLTHKKIAGILFRRNRWKFIKKVNKTIRKSRRVVWSKMRRFRTIVEKLFLGVLRALKVNAVGAISTPGITLTTQNGKLPIIRSNIVCSTPKNDSKFQALFPLDENSFEITEQHTPPRFNYGQINNSTPLNHNNQGLVRSRKDLSKTAFTDFKEIEEDDIPAAAGDFSILKENDSSNTFIRKPLDISSISRKKLLFKQEEFN